MALDREKRRTLESVTIEDIEGTIFYMVRSKIEMLDSNGDLDEEATAHPEDRFKGWTNLPGAAKQWLIDRIN